MIHNYDQDLEQQRCITGMAVGDFVMYTDTPTKMQGFWGNHDDSDKAGMKIGEIYEVVDIEIHNLYSYVMFKGIIGKFNPVAFTLVELSDKSDIAELRDHALGRAKKAKMEVCADFSKCANKWLINVQKCDVRSVIDCCDCIFNEN
jgi:hypothetical protein